MSPTSTEGRVWDGPTINGMPTKVHLVNRDKLPVSRFLIGMMEVINAAFGHGHPPYIPAEFTRILSTSQMLGELSTGGFSFIITRKSQGAEVVIATGSAVPGASLNPSEAALKPDEKKTSVDRSLEARKQIPGVVDWELKHLCVEPGYMRQGLAGYILELLDNEIKPKIRVMITTIAQMNGPMYLKRGYRTVELSSYSKGTLGGTAAFETWHMDRIMDYVPRQVTFNIHALTVEF